MRVKKITFFFKDIKLEIFNSIETFYFDLQKFDISFMLGREIVVVSLPPLVGLYLNQFSKSANFKHKNPPNSIGLVVQLCGN